VLVELGGVGAEGQIFDAGQGGQASGKFRQIGAAAAVRAFGQAQALHIPIARKRPIKAFDFIEAEPVSGSS